MKPSDLSPDAPGRLVPVDGTGWAFVPHPLPPVLAIDWELAGLAADATGSLGELAGLMRAMPNPHLLYAPFVRREAVLSSRIEGTRASLQDLVVHEAGGAQAGRSGDAPEVANYVRALEHALARRASLPVSLRLLREMHALLFEGLEAARLAPGEFRRSQNWIGRPGSSLLDATFVPPPPDALDGLLSDFETFLHQDGPLPPVVRLALIHYQFEAIHPFLDGNGRIGRLLILLLLVEWQLLPGPALVLSAYFERTRREYYAHLLSVSREGTWHAWLRYFLGGIVAESRDANRRSRALIELREDYRARVVQDTRSPGSALRILDGLFEVPALSIPATATALGLTQRTVQLQVARLEALAILRETTGRLRDRIFIAPGIIDIVDRGSA